MVRKVTKRLSNDLHTEVRIKHVSLELFNSMNLEGTLIRDQRKDTLLYAEQLKVRITDWFFLKDELVLKYVGLQNAYVNMYRQDSVWNYQFLADYFAPKKKSDKKKSNLKLDLKKLDFKNVYFKQNDGWVGSLMEVKVANMQLDADTFNLDKKHIAIAKIDLDKLFFNITDFEGKRPPVVTEKKQRQPGELYFNAGDLRLTVANLVIKNGTFQNLKNIARPAYNYFDPEYLRFEKINGTFSNISFIKDTIKASIDFATKERSGFEVKKLKTEFKLTPQIMEFAKLDLITPQSHLQNYFAMHFKDFNEDFKNFEDRVVMEVKFANTDLHSNTLAYFAPDLKSWKKQILISGYGKGTLGNLVTKNLFIRAGNNTIISGDLAVKGLPDINTTVFDFQNGQLQTNYRDAVLFIPAVGSIQNPSISSLGNIKFKGNFKGTTTQFATNGVYSTNLGGFTANIVMKLPEKTPAVYSGRVTTQRFNLGKFLRIKDMGTLSFDGTVKGVGLAINTLKTEVAGKISQFVYNNYSYKKINVEGTFQQKQFNGNIKIDDDNIDFVTNVKMDFRGKQPSFNVLGDLAHSNFRNLHFSDKQLEISGLFDLNFTGNNINDFLGSVKIYNANLLQDSIRLNFDSLTLHSGFEGGQRFLALRSNEFDASINGKFDILNLPNTFQLFLHNYYPAYIAKPRTNTRNQQFSFIVNTKNVEGYTLLFSKDITGFSNSSITGTINTNERLFELNADVPEFAVKKNRFQNISLRGTGNYEAFQMEGNIENIWLSDSTGFPNTNIKISSTKDVSNISIKTKANSTLNELNLNASLTTFTDGIKINFNASDFVINDKQWILEKEGEIIIRKGFVSAENVRFTQNEQHIVVETIHDSEFDQSNLRVKLENINIGDFSPLFMTSPRLEGLVTGEILMRDFFGKFKIEADLKADQFMLDNDSIGVVSIIGNYNSGNGKVGFNVISDNEAYRFTANGSYNLKDSVGSPLATSIKLNNTKVNIINKFLSSIFTDIDGYATGTLNINGDPSKPELLGKVTLRNGSLLVNFTKVKYTVDSATFTFSETGIDFGSFRIKDRYGNTGLVTGKLYERRLENLRFDLDISSNRMLMIDTKASDNPQFYGTAICRASMAITGPQENMRIAIDAEPVDTSQIYIPTSNSRESGKAAFIVFKQYGTEMKTETFAEETNVTVDLDLAANPLAKIDVILDPAAGDVIKARGNGRLRIHVGTAEPMTIKGRYEVVTGRYDFNFQSFLKKPFLFQENSGSYIEWNGDPYNAKMQVQAVYIAENVRLGDLVGNQNLSGNVQSYQGDVIVSANINGSLLKPNISFSIDFPAGSQVKNDETFSQFLAKMERDENEMLKQVTYLIVFNSFAPYGENKSLQSNFTALGVNTITEALSNVFNGIVSNLLRKTGLQFDLSPTVYNSSNMIGTGTSNNSSFDRAKVVGKLYRKFMNGKLIVTVSGDVDFSVSGNSSSSQQLGALQLLPDFTAEFILSRDRKVRAIVFSRNNLDISAAGVGRRNRTGASLSYRKDFNHVFSHPKENKEKPKDPPAPSAATLPQSEPAAIRLEKEED